MKTPNKRKVWPNLRRKSTGSAIHYYSDSFGKQVKKNPGLLKGLHSAMLNSAPVLEYGESVRSDGFTIKRLWKNDAGRSNAMFELGLKEGERGPRSGTFLVSRGKKKYFVKLTDPSFVHQDIQYLRKLQKFLDKRGGKINGFNLRTLNVLAVRLSSGYGMIVSDFIAHDRVKTYFELGEQMQKRINVLFKELSDEHLAFSFQNIFYEPASKTITVFDGE
tara:strand:+ start:6502 stop:7158 length:657 start_codon:yes stop_codon:yes gene_type:complete